MFDWQPAVVVPITVTVWLEYKLFTVTLVPVPELNVPLPEVDQLYVDAPPAVSVAVTEGPEVQSVGEFTVTTG